MKARPVMLAVIAGLCFAACGGGPSEVDIGSSALTTTTESSTTVPATTTVTTAVPPTTGPSTTVRRSTTSTRRATTTRQPATTARSPVPSGAGPAPCSAAQLSVEVTTDRATYRPGETVRARGTLRNRSAGSCFYTSYTGGERFEGPSGQLVRPASVFIADAFRETELAPGAALTQSPTWDQQTCADTGSPCSQAPPGTYTVKVSWGFSGPPVEGSATFQLVAA